MRITKAFTFDAAHRLSNYAGKCRNLHGHTYLLEITLEGKSLNNSGMLLDFGVLKKTVNGILDNFFDHKTILMKDDLINKKLFEAIPLEYNSFYMVDYNPTAENMAKDLCGRLKLVFKDPIVSRIKLYETPTSSVEYKNE